MIISALSTIWYYLWIYVPGWILTLVTRALVFILSYQNFANESIINRGWTVTRDLSNLFFIVILLVIALGTILRSSRYGYQQNLRRLVLMAILINFSKTIALFFIELSQAITLAFVNAFLDSLQAGFPQLLGLTNMLAFSPAKDAVSNAVTGLSVFVQIMLGGIMMVVALIVVLIITVIFLFRIIAFAFLIILAPIAFLLSAWPTGFTYYQRWWKELGNYAAVGPALAFFLWLSFSVVQPQSSQPEAVTGCLSSQLVGGGMQVGVSATNTEDADRALQEQTTAATADCPAQPESPIAQMMLRFIVGISLLIGGLKVAQELGVAGGSMANQWSGKISGALKGAAIGTGAAIGLGALAGARGTARFTGVVADKLTGGRASLYATRVNEGLQKVRESGAGRAVGTLGRIATSGPVKYATGAFVYDRLAEKAKVAMRQRQTAATSNFMKQLAPLTNEELVPKLDSIDPREARATAMTLDKRGYFNVGPEFAKGTPEYAAQLKQKKKLRAKAGIRLAEAGPDDPVSDHYSEFQKKYPGILSEDKLRERIATMNTSGDFEKFAAHWDWDAELMKIAGEAGITNKQLELLNTKMTKDEKKNFGEAIHGTVQAYDAVGNSDKARDMRILGAKVDSKNIARYASGDMPIGDLVSRLTPEQAAAIDIDSIEVAAPHLTSNQFIQMARTADPEKVSRAKGVALKALSEKITSGGLTSAEVKLANTLFSGDYIGNMPVADGYQAHADSVAKYTSDENQKTISKEEALQQRMQENMEAQEAKDKAYEERLKRERGAAAGTAQVETSEESSSSAATNGGKTESANPTPKPGRPGGEATSGGIVDEVK